MTQGVSDIQTREAKTFVVHNFSTIDKLVADISSQHEAMLASQRANYEKLRAEAAERRSRGDFLRAKGIAIMILALGAATLLVLLGYSFLRPDEKNEVEFVRQTASSKSQELKAQDKVGKTIINYVIFKAVPFNSDGIDVINVGLRYASDTSERPASQWCYVERTRPEGPASSTVITLANYADGKLRNSELRQDEAALFGTSVAVLRRAQQRCEFVK